MWQAWREHGILPRTGGWEDQPLDLVAKIGAIDLTFNTRSYLLAKGSDWTKLTPTQNALVHWLKGDDD